jgi:hypothetical protein
MSFYALIKNDRRAKSLFPNEIEHFWKKIRDEGSVKVANCLVPIYRESLAQGFIRCHDSEERSMNPNNADGVSKFDFLRDQQE